MKKKIFILFIALILLISGKAFADFQYPNVGSREFQELLSEVILKEKNPEVLTDRVIVKEYHDDGSYTYKSIAKDEYGKIIYGTSQDSKRRVDYVQPDYIRYASYEIGKNSLSWGKGRIGAQFLIDKIGETTEEVIVAVLDTGVDYNHKFLRNRIVEGFNIVDDNNDPMDYNSHGTHVARIIADATNDNVKIMPVKVLSDDGYGYDSDIAKGIYYAVENGADIINMSLGGPGYSHYMAQAIDYAVSQDVLVVVAAGNEGSNTMYFYPASEEKAIVVSATDEYDNFANFSNYGSSVDIAAPGVNIYSSVPNDGYESYNGTSMATPYISAIAALIKLEDPNRSIYMIEEILKNHTDDLGIPGRDDYFGEGIVNVSNYATKSEEFILISPNNNTTHYENITMKYYIENCIGASIIIRINEEIVFEDKILEDGYKTEYINLKDKYKGPVILSITIEKDDEILHHEELEVIIEQFNTSFRAYDYNNNKQDIFAVKIYGIKDDKVVNFDMGLDSEPLYWLDSMAGEVKVDLDYEKLFSLYDSLVVVASDGSSDTMPVYVRELTGAGDYVFKPDKLQKISFKNYTPIEGYGIYNSSIYPSYKGILLPWSLAGTYTLGEDAVLYADEGNHFVSFHGFNFTLADRINGTGETEFVLNEDDSTQIRFIGDSSLSGVDGYYEGNYVLAWILAREERLIDLGSLILNPGENNHRIYHGNYTLSFIKEVPEKGIIRLYKDFTADKSNSQLRFEYGGPLRSGFKLFYNSNKVEGIVDIRDEHGNVVILNNMFYSIHEFNISSPEGTQSITYKPSSFNWQTHVILENKKDGSKYYALVDGNNYFTFDYKIPDGEYKLYTDFETEIFPYTDTKFDVEIKNNTFISTYANN